MSEDKEKGQRGTSRTNFSPDQLKKFLRKEAKNDSGLFSQVSQHSRDYIDALGLNAEDVEELERRQGRLGMYPGADEFMQGALLKVETEGKKFAIFAKNTASHDYGPHGWEYLLMATSDDRALNKDAGNGTTWITAVPEEWHSKILQAIKDSSQRDDLSGELFGFLDDD